MTNERKVCLRDARRNNMFLLLWYLYVFWLALTGMGALPGNGGM